MKPPAPRNHAFRSLPTIAILGFICLAGHAEETTSTPAPINEPIVLDKFAVKAARQRADIYQVKADDVFDSLRVERKIRYATVILKSYDTSKFDLIETLVAKKRYRETIAKGHTFYCNYAAINTDIPVYFEMYDEIRGVAQASSGLAGSMYSFKKKKIQIRQGGDKTKIYHAAGAALSGFIAPENKATIEEIGRKKKDAEFVKQVNFEVRLQDLNRFYSVLTAGFPIRTPIDAVRAMKALGAELKKPLVEKILARNHIDFKSEELDQAIATKISNDVSADTSTDSNGSSATTFTIAQRLVEGLSGSEGGLFGGRTFVEGGLNDLSGKEYEDYIERILIEAPGHI